MRFSDAEISEARRRMDRIERHVATRGISDTTAFDRHVVEFVAGFWDEGIPEEPFRSELIDWGLSMIRVDTTELCERLRAKHEVSA